MIYEEVGQQDFQDNATKKISMGVVFYLNKMELSFLSLRRVRCEFRVTLRDCCPKYTHQFLIFIHKTISSAYSFGPVQGVPHLQPEDKCLYARDPRVDGWMDRWISHAIIITIPSLKVINFNLEPGTVTHFTKFTQNVHVCFRV